MNVEGSYHMIAPLIHAKNTVWCTNVPTFSCHRIGRFTGSIDEWIIHSKTPVCDSIIGDKCESNVIAVTSVYIRQCGATIPHRFPHTNAPVIIQQYIWRTVQTGFQVELTEGNQDHLGMGNEIPPIPWIQRCARFEKTIIYISLSPPYAPRNWNFNIRNRIYWTQLLSSCLLVNWLWEESGDQWRNGVITVKVRLNVTSWINQCEIYMIICVLCAG